MVSTNYHCRADPLCTDSQQYIPLLGFPHKGKCTVHGMVGVVVAGKCLAFTYFNDAFQPAVTALQYIHNSGHFPARVSTYWSRYSRTHARFTIAVCPTLCVTEARH